MVKDGAGIVGSLWHYSMLFTLIGSTALVFLYLWRKDRLDMDEEAKYQMLEPDEDTKDG